jgi:hypothetical protein
MKLFKITSVRRSQTGPGWVANAESLTLTHKTGYTGAIGRTPLEAARYVKRTVQRDIVNQTTRELRR